MPRRESSPALKRSTTPGDFDWGDGEADGRAGLLEDTVDEDDILGNLTKPVIQQTSRAPKDGHSKSAKPAQPKSSSPLPHVLGKLVEMGFSVQQARVALAATETGVDVEGAMEFLLAQSAVDPQDPEATRKDRDPAPNGLSSREREEAERRRRHQERRRGPSRATGPTAQDEQVSRVKPRPKSDEDDDHSADTLGQLADHADKVLAQATEIGTAFFSKRTRSGRQQIKSTRRRRRRETSLFRPLLVCKDELARISHELLTIADDP